MKALLLDSLVAVRRARLSLARALESRRNKRKDNTRDNAGPRDCTGSAAVRARTVCGEVTDGRAHDLGNDCGHGDGEVWE